MDLSCCLSISPLARILSSLHSLIFPSIFLFLYFPIIFPLYFQSPISPLLSLFFPIPWIHNPGLGVSTVLYIFVFFFTLSLIHRIQPISPSWVGGCLLEKFPPFPIIQSLNFPISFIDILLTYSLMLLSLQWSAFSIL